MNSKLIYATIEDVIQQRLHECADNLQAQLNAIGESIAEAFLSTPERKSDELMFEMSQGSVLGFGEATILLLFGDRLSVC